MALDGIGIFLEPADLVNAVPLVEGELVMPPCPASEHAPDAGRFVWERRERDEIPAESSGDLTKLNRNKKVVKVLETPRHLPLRHGKRTWASCRMDPGRALITWRSGGDEVIEL